MFLSIQIKVVTRLRVEDYKNIYPPFSIRFLGLYPSCAVNATASESLIQRISGNHSWRDRRASCENGVFRWFVVIGWAQLDPLKAYFGCLLGELDYYPGVRVLDTC